MENWIFIATLAKEWWKAFALSEGLVIVLLSLSHSSGNSIDRAT